MIRHYNQNEMYLLPPSLQDFVPPHHPVHLINDLVDRLDLTVLESRYGPIGQPAYSPRLILKVMLYGYATGLFSTRRWQRACEENLAFKYLAGMQQPSYKTFTEFRKRHRKDMEEVFYQTVKLAREMGLVKFANIALDGSKVDANTSRYRAMSYGRMSQEEKRLRDEIKGLLGRTEQEDEAEDGLYGKEEDGYHLSGDLADKEKRLKALERAKAALEERGKKEHPGQAVADKKVVSFADPAARCFTKKGHGTRFVYNAQVAVDMDSQIIVENHIEDSTRDARAAEATLQNMDEHLQENPEKLVTDTGYASEAHGAACEKYQVTPVCGTNKEQPSTGADNQGMNALEYDKEADTFRCSHGIVFAFERETGSGERRKRVYRSATAPPCTCGPRRRGLGCLYVENSHLMKRAFQRIMSRAENKALYRRRKCTVEPVIGQIKAGMGFRRFLCRDTQKVTSEWHLVCSAANLKKMSALRLAKGWGKRAVPAWWQKITHQVRLLANLISPTILDRALCKQPV